MYFIIKLENSSSAHVIGCIKLCDNKMDFALNNNQKQLKQ